MTGWLLALLVGPVKALARLWSWMAQDLRHFAIVLLIVGMMLAAWGWWSAAQARDDWRHSATEWEATAGAWKAAQEGLVADITARQAEAAAADRANSVRVDREFKQIIERTAHDYQDRLDDTGAALQRVRGDLARSAAADHGDSSAAAVPETLTARCRAVAAADCDALLVALPDRLAAAETNTARLIALQGYVRSVLSIDYAGGPDGADPSGPTP